MDGKIRLDIDDFHVESFDTQTDDATTPLAALAMDPTEATRCFYCPRLRPSVDIC